MRDYELMVILSPLLDEQGISSAVEQVKGFIAQRGGTVTREDHWGSRHLAYPIRKGGQAFNDGNYHLLWCSLEPGRVKELDNSLKISDQVIRHLLVQAGAPQPPDHIGAPQSQPQT